MIEQLLEKRVIDKVAEVIKASGVDGISIIGAWQPSAEGTVKGIETAGDLGILSVKTKPREYATPTIPHATFDTTVSFSMRVEADPTGKKRLDVADRLVSLLYEWQASFEDFKVAFDGLDGLAPCGFTLVGGDVGLDRTASLWTCSYSFTINAVITNK